MPAFFREQDSEFQAAFVLALLKVKPPVDHLVARAWPPATRPDRAACPVMRGVDSRLRLVDYDFPN